MSVIKALVRSALAIVVGGMSVCAGMGAIYGAAWLFLWAVTGIGSATCEAVARLPAVAWLPRTTDALLSDCSEGIYYGIGIFACMGLVGCYGLGASILGSFAEKRAEAEKKRQHAERMDGYREEVRRERAEAGQTSSYEGGPSAIFTDAVAIGSEAVAPEPNQEKGA